MLSRELGLIDAELEVIGVKADAAMDVQLTTAEATAKEQVLTIGLLIGSDHAHYGMLLEDLENDFTQGQDNYPMSLHQAYSLLVHWKQAPHNIIRLIGGTNDRMAFTNVGSEDLGQSGGNSGTNIGWVKHWWCYNYSEVGHISHNCMEECPTGTDVMPTQLLMQGVEDLVINDSYQFAQCDGHLPTSWFILNTGSMVNVFSNCSLLKNVHETNHYMHIHCNARWSYTNQMGDLPGYPGEVCYNPHGIVNILCFADICDHFCVQFNSGKEQAFLVEKPDGTTKHFIQLKARLYFNILQSRTPPQFMITLGR